MFNSILLIMTRGYAVSNLHPKTPVLVIGTNLYTPTMFFSHLVAPCGTMAGGSNPTISWDSYLETPWVVLVGRLRMATPGVCTDHHRSMPTRSQTRYAYRGCPWISRLATQLATFDYWRVKLVDPFWIVGQWFFEGPVDHSGSLYQDTYNYFQCMFCEASYLHHISSVSLRIGDPKVEIFPVDRLFPHEGYRMWYLQWIGWKIGPQASEPYRSHGANDDVLWNFSPKPHWFKQHLHLLETTGQCCQLLGTSWAIGTTEEYYAFTWNIKNMKLQDDLFCCCFKWTHRSWVQCSKHTLQGKMPPLLSTEWCFIFKSNGWVHCYVCLPEATTG